MAIYTQIGLSCRPGTGQGRCLRPCRRSAPFAADQSTTPASARVRFVRMPSLAFPSRRHEALHLRPPRCASAGLSARGASLRAPRGENFETPPNPWRQLAASAEGDLRRQYFQSSSAHLVLYVRPGTPPVKRGDHARRTVGRSRARSRPDRPAGACSWRLGRGVERGAGCSPAVPTRWTRMRWCCRAGALYSASPSRAPEVGRPAHAEDNRGLPLARRAS